MKSQLQISCVFLLFISHSYAQSIIHQTFLQCLQKTTNQPNISSILYIPTNPSFPTLLQAYIRNARFNTTRTPKPLMIIAPSLKSQVGPVVTCSQTAGLHLKIRSGGHDYDGTSYVSDSPFVILDMFRLRDVSIDAARRTARVESGATLGEFYYKIWKASPNLAFPAGICPTVAVGGHISGGGYGILLRKFGLSIDYVIDAEIVTVEGNILDRRRMGEDLFWAIRGGGGASFGVILSYTVKLVVVPSVVTVFRVEDTIENKATEKVSRWMDVADKIDPNLFIRVLIQPVSSKLVRRTRTIRATFIALFLGGSDGLVSVMNRDFPELGIGKGNCKEMSWMESILYWTNFDNATRPEALLVRNPGPANRLKRKSDYLKQAISRNDLERLWKRIVEIGKTGLVLNPYGGRMGEVGGNETAFPHRSGNICKIQYSVNWEDGGLDGMYVSQIRRLYNYTAKFVSKSPRGAFLNYRDLDIGINRHGKESYEEGSVYGRKYFMGNFDRLVKVKTVVDPHNFFRNEQSIPTSPPNV